MMHLRRYKPVHVLNWLCFRFSANQPLAPFDVPPNPRFYRRKLSVDTEITGYFNNGRGPVICVPDGRKIPRATWTAAQAVLLDYLHATRSFQFMDAENISKNSPHFLCKILQKIEDDPVDIRRSVTRFLRYHPVNEFEPFLESLGLKPSEYAPLLPRELMFLSDDALLLENYHVLCNYGVPRNKIGKIYKEATQVFRYEKGVMLSNLKAYEELGLTQTKIIKFVVSSPSLLVGRVNGAFVEVLEKLKKMGFDCVWIENQMSENESYNWRRMLHFLHFLSEIGCSEEQLSGLIGQHPDLLFKRSGNVTISLIGLLVKFGSNMDEIYKLFLQLPQIPVAKFVQNLLRGIILLKEIDMETGDIGKIICAHTLLLGTCSLKKANSLLANLNIGKKRLSAIIKDNPLQMRNWVIGKRVEPISNPQTDALSREHKTEFLLDLGFTEGSNEMEKALKVFRGRGGELQDRFNCFLKAGLNRKDVTNMVKVAPQVLNQSVDVIEKKMDFLVNGLGYRISALVVFPSYLSYTIQRVKLRHSMYNWLKSQGAAEPTLALSTIIASSDQYFTKVFVNRLPKGPQMWIDLKKKIYSD